MKLVLSKTLMLLWMISVVWLPASAAEQPAAAVLEKARQLIENPPYDGAGAATLLAEAAKKTPGNAALEVALGDALVSAGKLDEASVRFAAVLSKIEPSSVPARWGKSRLLLRQSRPAEALELLAEALRLAPDDPRTMARIGAAHLLTDRPDRLAQARSWFEQASLAAPGDPGYIQWTVLAYLLEDRAADVSEKVRYLGEKFAGSSPALWAQAATDEVRGRMAEASDGYRKAAAVDPRNFIAHYSLGQLLAGRGNREWAKAAIEPAAFAGLTDLDVAARHLTRVLAGATEFPFAPAARATLDSLARRQKESPWKSLSPQALKEFHQYGKALGEHY